MDVRSLGWWRMEMAGCSPSAGSRALAPGLLVICMLLLLGLIYRLKAGPVSGIGALPSSYLGLSAPDTKALVLLVDHSGSRCGSWPPVPSGISLSEASSTASSLRRAEPAI